jgi:glycosyltransferase involved in cell wall biosynthesis
VESDLASRPPRVLYVCLERIVPGGAAATHVRAICDGLREQGFEVRLEAEEGEGPRGGLGARMARYRRILARALRALGWADIVYVRSHFAALPLAIAAKRRDKPVVHEINGPYGDAFVTHPRFRRVRTLLRGMQRAQYRWSKALIAVTPDLVVWGRRQAGHDRVFLVSNAADTALFRPEGPYAMRERRFALFFGGLVRWHGVDTMLAAVRSTAWPADLDLLVAGPIIDDSLRGVFAALPANATWIGPQPQAELPALIRAAVAALVPISDPGGRSARGVMPLKLFEALACGTPAIVTDLRGQADLVRAGECGLVVPVGDAEALARAVAEIASDPERRNRLGHAGAQLVAAEHSWTARAVATAGILRQAMQP